MHSIERVSPELNQLNRKCYALETATKHSTNSSFSSRGMRKFSQGAEESATKGPYILEAVQTLNDVLRRMQSDQEKKGSMMRPLKLAERFFTKAGADPHKASS